MIYEIRFSFDAEVLKRSQPSSFDLIGSANMAHKRLVEKRLKTGKQLQKERDSREVILNG